MWFQSLLSGSGLAERGRTALTGGTVPSQHLSLWSGPGTGNTSSSNLKGISRKEICMLNKTT